MKSKSSTKMSAKYILIVLAASLMALTSAITSSSMGLFIVPVTTELNLDRAGFSLVISIISLAGLFMGPVWGQLMGKKGAKKVAIWTAIGTTAAFAVFAISKSMVMFYIAGALLGVFCCGCSTLAATTLLSTWFIEKRGLMINIAVTSISVGCVIAGLVIPTAVETIGYSATFLICGAAVFLLVVPLTALVVKNTPMEVGLTPYGYNEEQAAAAADIVLPGIEFGKAIKSPTFYLAFIALFCLVIPSAFVNHYAGYSMELGLDAVSAGQMVSVVSFSSMIFTIVAGALSDKLGALKTTVIYEIINIVAWVMLYMATDAKSLLIASIPIGLGMSFACGMPAVLAGSMFGAKDFSRIFSMLSPAMSLGMIVINPVVGSIFDKTGSYKLACIMNIAVIVVGLICVILAIKSSKKLWAEQAAAEQK